METVILYLLFPALTLPS